MPFPPRRFYYIHNVAPAARRGGHAHRIEEELIIAITGRFKITVKDDRAQDEFDLCTPREALYMPPMIWHELHDFAPGTVCAVLASIPYDPSDYIHRYEEYLALLDGGAD